MKGGVDMKIIIQLESQFYPIIIKDAIYYDIDNRFLNIYTYNVVTRYAIRDVLKIVIDRKEGGDDE